MQRHPKNQHYVPQFLLKNFYSKDINHIWCYDKTFKNTEERSISKVASENYFYDTIAGQEEGSLEYLLSKAETETAPIISKIIKTKKIEILTIDEKEILALFIALQLNRTKSAFKNYERFNEYFFGKIKEIYNAFNLEHDFGEKTKKEVWLSNFSDTPIFASILINKLWFLLESDSKFYTSDNPVVLQNSINRKEHRGTLGLNSDGIEIYFPLSDSLAIILLCERVYGALRGKKLPLMMPENIENMNALQVIYSERFIFSSQNNFELVKDMLSKGQT